MYFVQTEEGHGRYLILRNCRDPSAFRVLAGRAADAIASTACYFNRRARVAASNPETTLPQTELAIEVVMHDIKPSPSAGASPKHDTPSPRSLAAPAALKHPADGNCGSGVSGSTIEYIDAAEEERDMVETNFRVSVTSTMRRGGATDTLDAALIAAMRRAPLGSIWDAGSPVAALLARRWAVPGLLGITIAAATGMGAMPPPPGGGGLVLCRLLRFTALETRAGMVSHCPGIGDIGLLREGFARVLASRRRGAGFVAGASLTVEYAEAVEADGWWFTTAANQSSTDDPAHFLAECAADAAGTEWRPLGASAVAWAWSGRPALDPAGGPAYAAPMARGATVPFDMRPPWAWAAAGHAWQTLFAALALSLAVLAAARRPLLARYSLVVCSSTDAVICTAVAVMHAHGGNWGLAGVSIGLGVLAAGYLPVFLVAENILRQYGFFVGVVGLTILAVHYALLLPHDGTRWPGPAAGSFFENRGALWSAGLIYASFSGWARRRRCRARARAIVAEDEKAYSDCWAAVCVDSDAVARLRSATDNLRHKVCNTTAALAEAAAAAQASFTVTLPGDGGTPRVRQLSRNQQTTALRDSKTVGVDGLGCGENQSSIGRPVRDLDLLFAQAKGLLPHLRRKVSLHAT
jgi:hypothetical protein